MSPRLQGVVGGMLRVVPELEGRLSQTEPGQLFRGRSEHGRKPVHYFLLGLRGKIPKGSEDLFNRPARDSHGSRIVSDGRAAVKVLRGRAAGRPSVGPCRGFRGFPPSRSAHGLSRSVTMISSPRLLRRRYWLSRFLSSLIPTVLMPVYALVAVLDTEYQLVDFADILLEFAQSFPLAEDPRDFSYLADVPVIVAPVFQGKRCGHWLSFALILSRSRSPRGLWVGEGHQLF